MPRPVKKRHICAIPDVKEFLPGSRCCTETVELGLDEFETIRLIDYLCLTQDDCARQMNVARTTVQAVYNTARQKLADALVNGKRLVITGGSYLVCPSSGSCCGRDCVRRDCRERNCSGCCPCLQAKE